MTLQTSSGPFLVFCGESYYPNGGAYDCYGKYVSLEEALARAEELFEINIEFLSPNWAHILDVNDMTVITVRADPDLPPKGDACYETRHKSFLPRHP